MKINKHKKGQAMVETALVLPIIILIVFGIIEFGRILNTYIVLTNASREGARYSAVGKDNTFVDTAVINRAAPIPIKISNIDIDHDKTDPKNYYVTVTISYDLPLITPVIRNLISPGGTFNIKTSTIMRSE